MPLLDVFMISSRELRSITFSYRSKHECVLQTMQVHNYSIQSCTKYIPEKNATEQSVSLPLTVYTINVLCLILCLHCMCCSFQYMQHHNRKSCTLSKLSPFIDFYILDICVKTNAESNVMTSN